MPAMPRSNIHLDILEGRDETLDVADFFSEFLFSCNTYPYPSTYLDFEPHPTTDIHSEMERKQRL